MYEIFLMNNYKFITTHPLSNFYFFFFFSEDMAPNILPNGKLTKSNSCNVGQVTQIIWTGFFNIDKVKLLLEKFR